MSVTDLNQVVLRTDAGKALLLRLHPEVDPAKCPLNNGTTEHDTYGGLCHCGWSRNEPQRAGRARPPTLLELSGLIADVEAGL